MITKVEAYRTTDGKLFSIEGEADLHQADIDAKVEFHALITNIVNVKNFAKETVFFAGSKREELVMFLNEAKYELHLILNSLIK